jgi:hypothetical protein
MISGPEQPQTPLTNLMRPIDPRLNAFLTTKHANLSNLLVKNRHWLDITADNSIRSDSQHTDSIYNYPDHEHHSLLSLPSRLH